MLRARLLIAGVAAGILLGWGGGGGAFAAEQTAGRAPCPPVMLALPQTAQASSPKPYAAVPRAATQVYSHGDPTGDEQAMLEMINRARANPTAEGVRLATTTDPDVLSAYQYFSVDTAKVQADFAGYPVRPPLAFNAQLIAAARGHSQDMNTNNYQGHTGSDGSTFDQRISTAGYTGGMAEGENVYAYSETVWYGHAGFNVDWGNATPGHRSNIMNYQGAVYNEVGIGIVNGDPASGHTGPLIVTQDFGQRNANVYLVGVVYRDANGNSFYDSGEGVGGVTVTPDTGTYYAVSSTSGGFAIPIAGLTGTLNVTFSGGALSGPAAQSVTLTGGNVKLDCVVPASGAGGDSGGSGSDGSGGDTTAPVALSQCVSTIESTPLNIVLSGSGKGTLSYAITESPAHGALSELNSAAGTVLYTPATGYTGTDSFKFSVTGSDGTSAGMVAITVVASGTLGSTSSQDSDGDGYPDELEVCLGASPTTAGTPPAAQTFASPAKLSVKLNFAKTGKDSLSFSWPQVLGAGYQPKGCALTLDVGGAVASFTLDAKGKAKTDVGACQMRGKFKNGVATAGQTATVTVKLAKSTLSPALADEGLGDDRVYQHASVTVPVYALFSDATGNTLVVGTVQLDYSAKPQKTGSGKGGL